MFLPSHGPRTPPRQPSDFKFTPTSEIYAFLIFEIIYKLKLGAMEELENDPSSEMLAIALQAGRLRHLYFDLFMQRDARKIGGPAVTKNPHCMP